MDAVTLTHNLQCKLDYESDNAIHQSVSGQDRDELSLGMITLFVWCRVASVTWPVTLVSSPRVQIQSDLVGGPCVFLLIDYPTISVDALRNLTSPKGPRSSKVLKKCIKSQ